jgi:hypothetical protein
MELWMKKAGIKIMDESSVERIDNFWRGKSVCKT